MALASSSALRHMGITERCPCLGGCVLRDSALRIRAVPPATNLPRTESASTGTLLSPSYPALRVRIQVRTPRRKPQALHASSCQRLPKRCAVFRVSVVQQIANLGQTQPPLCFQGRIPCHLLHPALLRLIRDACDGHPSGLQMEKEEYIIGHQPTPCQHLYGEEIRSRQHGHVTANELAPGCGAFPLRRRRDALAAQDVADRLIAHCVPQIG